MSVARIDLLEQTVATIQQRWGARALYKHHTGLQRHSFIPSGVENLERRLGVGGLAHGQVTALLPRATSGLTTLVHAFIASAQGQGDAVGYLDVDQTFDPDYAVRCGVYPHRLLLAHPATLEQTLSIARDLVETDGLGLLVIDAGQRGDVGKWRATLARLRLPLAQSCCAVLLLVPFTEVNRAVAHDHAFLTLSAVRQRWLHADDGAWGYETGITVLKDRLGLAGRTAALQILFHDVGQEGRICLRVS